MYDSVYLSKWGLTMTEFSEDLLRAVKALPLKPGVYLFKDKKDEVIYVGMSKSLRKRVSSYFQKNHDRTKTRRLVSRIVSFDFIVVETEADALLLESSLIKKYRPHYNVLLKDDKTYPWLCIKKERFPRVFSTRRLLKDGSEYFGPYASVKMMNTMLDLIRQIYPLRTCNLNLSEASIEQGKHKVCLEYHIKKCLGPCEGHQSLEDYNDDIQSIRQILKGNTKEVLVLLEEKMKGFAANLEFEKAQTLKDKWDLLKNYQVRSSVVSAVVNRVDVFSIISDVKYAYVNFFKIMSGAIVQSYTSEIKKQMDESDSELLKRAIVELKERFHSDSTEIITNIPVDIDGRNWHFAVPQRGDRKKLIELSEKNARYQRLERLKQMSMVDPERHSNRIMEQVKHDLRMEVLPEHIECFDNSNIQGTNPVAACVVFKKAKPSKKDYRHFNIKTVVGPDDYASMEEVVYRRYKRLKEENEPLPQLIVIDGGKGQLSSALKALEELDLRGKIAIVGIAKRLEEIYFPGDSLPLYIDKRSESLKLIQQLRNEAHRFGITHHRKKRINAGIKSELENIEGIGPDSIQKLLSEFRSVKIIKETAKEKLEKVVGKAKANLVFDYYHKNNGKS